MNKQIQVTKGIHNKRSPTHFLQLWFHLHLLLNGWWLFHPSELSVNSPDCTWSADATMESNHGRPSPGWSPGRNQGISAALHHVFLISWSIQVCCTSLTKELSKSIVKSFAQLGNFHLCHFGLFGAPSAAPCLRKSARHGSKGCQNRSSTLRLWREVEGKVFLSLAIRLASISSIHDGMLESFKYRTRYK